MKTKKNKKSISLSDYLESKLKMFKEDQPINVNPTNKENTFNIIIKNKAAIEQKLEKQITVNAEFIDQEKTQFIRNEYKKAKGQVLPPIIIKKEKITQFLQMICDLISNEPFIKELTGNKKCFPENYMNDLIVDQGMEFQLDSTAMLSIDENRDSLNKSYLNKFGQKKGEEI